VDDASVADRLVRIPLTNCGPSNQGGTQNGSAFSFNPGGSVECVFTRPRDAVAGSTFTVRVQWISQRVAVTQEWGVGLIAYEPNTAATTVSAVGTSASLAGSLPTVTAVSFAATALGTNAEMVRATITPTPLATGGLNPIIMLGALVEYQATR